MAKSSEAKRIAAEVKNEFEGYKNRVMPKFHRKARGKLKRLNRLVRKIAPLKAKAHAVGAAERQLKAKVASIKSRISTAKGKISSDKARIRSLTAEVRRLKREVPQLSRNVRAWGRAERATARKHKKVWKALSRLENKIAKEMRRRDKVLHSLQKYF